MSTAGTSSPKSNRQRLEGVQLRVSPYERVASTIVALLAMVSFAVLTLAVLVITRRMTSPPPAIAVQLLDEPSGRGDHATGTELDMQAPGQEEFPDLSEPRIEELINSVSDVLAANAPSVDTFGVSASAGLGSGDRRAPGPLGDADVIPRTERWEVAYPATTLDTYARQLDFFGIELGVVGGGRKVMEYVSDFSSAQPKVRSLDKAAEERRLYFTWRSGRLQEFDRQLVARAGVPLSGRQVLQFYPPEVEQRLAVLETEAAGGRTARAIAKTRFAVRRAGSGFEFYVEDIRQRTFR